MILALLVAAPLFGLLGMVLAVPVAAAVKILAGHWWASRTLRMNSSWRGIRALAGLERRPTPKVIPVPPTREPAWRILMSNATPAAAVRRVVDPVKDFLQTEAAGGLFLLAATVVALGWANSPFAAGYKGLWSTELMIGAGAAGASPWRPISPLQSACWPCSAPGSPLAPRCSC